MAKTLDPALQDYFNGLCCGTPVVTYNFDVDSSDWAGGGITDQASFDSVLGVTTDQFLLSGNNIQANILTTTGDILEFRSQTVTNVNYITINGLISLDLSGNQIVTFNPSIALPTSLQVLSLDSNQIVTFNPTLPLPTSLQVLYVSSNQIVTFNVTIALPSGLQELYLYSNQIVTFNPTLTLPSSLQILDLSGNQIISFNPTIPLPSSLVFLGLNDNQMTTAGYTASESWANGMHTAPSGGQINLNSNPNSVTGTNLETILIGKGWAVTF